MKTIIVPTDFSPTAVNAANYALDMALQINASVTLLNVYQLPIAVTETPIIFVSVEELKDAAEKKLQTLKTELDHVSSGKLEIYTEARLGIMPDELEDLCRKLQPFAIVMGTTGHSSVERVLFGSNTLSVIKHLTWPVICVPKGTEYGTGIKKIGLACDFRELTEVTPFSTIREFVKEFNGELHVLNVEQKEAQSNDAHQQSVLLQTALENLSPQYHIIQHKDIEDGINEFAETNNLDMVITIPKKHKRLEGLFQKSSTRQLVFESHVPVMCIHE